MQFYEFQSWKRWAIMYILCVLILYLPLHGTEAEENEYQVRIDTRPSSGFIQAANLAPGDQIVSSLEIVNQGKQDFRYAVSTRLQAGVPDFYDILTLKILDQETVFFEGSIADVEELMLGTLPSMSNKELTFIAELPIGMGNEMQGKSATVAFDFRAQAAVDQGADASTSPPPPVQEIGAGERLPQTATPWYNMMLLSLLLIGCGFLFWRWRTD